MASTSNDVFDAIKDKAHALWQSALRRSSKTSSPEQICVQVIFRVGYMLGLDGQAIEAQLNLKDTQSMGNTEAALQQRFSQLLIQLTKLHNEMAHLQLPRLDELGLSLGQCLHRTFHVYARKQLGQGRYQYDVDNPRLNDAQIFKVFQDASILEPQGSLPTANMHVIMAAHRTPGNNSLRADFKTFMRLLAAVASELEADVFIPVAALGLLTRPRPILKSLLLTMDLNRHWNLPGASVDLEDSTLSKLHNLSWEDAGPLTQEAAKPQPALPQVPTVSVSSDLLAEMMARIDDLQAQVSVLAERQERPVVVEEVKTAAEAPADTVTPDQYNQLKAMIDEANARDQDRAKLWRIDMDRNTLDLRKLQQQVAVLEQRLGVLEESFEDQRESSDMTLGNIQERVAGLVRKANQLTNSKLDVALFSDLQASLATLDREKVRAESRLTHLESEVQMLKLTGTTATSPEAAAPDAGKKLTTTQSEEVEITAPVKQLAEQLASLQAEYTGSQALNAETIKEVTALVDTARTEASDKHTALQESLAALQQQVASLTTALNEQLGEGGHIHAATTRLQAELEQQEAKYAATELAVHHVIGQLETLHGGNGEEGEPLGENSQQLQRQLEQLQHAKSRRQTQMDNEDDDESHEHLLTRLTERPDEGEDGDQSGSETSDDEAEEEANRRLSELPPGSPWRDSDWDSDPEEPQYVALQPVQRTRKVLAVPPPAAVTRPQEPADSAPQPLETGTEPAPHTDTSKDQTKTEVVKTEAVQHTLHQVMNDFARQMGMDIKLDQLTPAELAAAQRMAARLMGKKAPESIAAAARKAKIESEHPGSTPDKAAEATEEVSQRGKELVEAALAATEESEAVTAARLAVSVLGNEDNIARTVLVASSTYSRAGSPRQTARSRNDALVADECLHTAQADVVSEPAAAEQPEAQNAEVHGRSGAGEATMDEPRAAVIEAGVNDLTETATAMLNGGQAANEQDEEIREEDPLERAAADAQHALLTFGSGSPEATAAVEALLQAVRQVVDGSGGVLPESARAMAQLALAGYSEDSEATKRAASFLAKHVFGGRHSKAHAGELKDMFALIYGDDTPEALTAATVARLPEPVLAATDPEQVEAHLPMVAHRHGQDSAEVAAMEAQVAVMCHGHESEEANAAVRNVMRVAYSVAASRTTSLATTRQPSRRVGPDYYNPYPINTVASAGSRDAVDRPVGSAAVVSGHSRPGSARPMSQQHQSRPASARPIHETKVSHSVRLKLPMDDDSSVDESVRSSANRTRSITIKDDNSDEDRPSPSKVKKRSQLSKEMKARSFRHFRAEDDGLATLPIETIVRLPADMAAMAHVVNALVDQMRESKVTKPAPGQGAAATTVYMLTMALQEHGQTTQQQAAKLTLLEAAVLKVAKQMDTIMKEWQARDQQQSPAHVSYGHPPPMTYHADPGYMRNRFGGPPMPRGPRESSGFYGPPPPMSSYPAPYGQDPRYGGYSQPMYGGYGPPAYPPDGRPHVQSITLPDDPVPNHVPRSRRESSAGRFAQVEARLAEEAGRTSASGSPPALRSPSQRMTEDTWTPDSRLTSPPAATGSPSPLRTSGALTTVPVGSPRAAAMHRQLMMSTPTSLSQTLQPQPPAEQAPQRGGSASGVAWEEHRLPEQSFSPQPPPRHQGLPSAWDDSGSSGSPLATRPMSGLARSPSQLGRISSGSGGATGWLSQVNPSQTSSSPNLPRPSSHGLEATRISSTASLRRSSPGIATTPEPASQPQAGSLSPYAGPAPRAPKPSGVAATAPGAPVQPSVNMAAAIYGLNPPKPQGYAKPDRYRKL